MVPWATPNAYEPLPPLAAIVRVYGALTRPAGSALSAIVDEHPTFTTNSSVAVNTPSDTVTAIVAVPVLFVAGVTVTVRPVPAPAKARCARSLGTSAGLLDVPVTVNAPAAVSGSAIEN